MEIARLTEQVVEYLFISSTLLFLLGLLSLIAVQLFRIKGKTKIWVFALVFILPVIYPVRSLLPESIMIPVPMQFDYIKPLTVITRGNPVSAETSFLPIASHEKRESANSKIISAEKDVSSWSLRERLLDTVSLLYKNWKQIAAIIWALIFSIFFIRMIAAAHTIKKFLRLSIPVTDQRIMRLLRECTSDTGLTYVPVLYEMQGISTPMAMGFLKPVIIIPSHIVTEKYIHGLKFTLLHELKHIDQRHNLWLLIESLIGAIYFFHPVIHWVKSKIHEEMEKICDGHVVKVTHKNVTYADFLLNEIWQNSPGRYSSFSLPFISSASKTADRVRSILENRAISASMQAREIIVAVSVFIVFSSFMFITGATRIHGQEKMADSKSPVETINRLTEPVQTGHIKHKKTSSVTTPGISPEDNMVMEAVTTRKNAVISAKSEQVTERLYEKPVTGPVNKADSTAENTDIDKAIQTPEKFPEPPESVIFDKSDISANISNAADNPAIDTPVQTLMPMAETTAQKYLGTPVKELTAYYIDNIKALDQYTILFLMRGGDIYLTRLSGPCPALLFANSYMRLSITGRLSKLDHIQVMLNNNIIGVTGMFGDFYPYKYQGNKAEAIKLLKKTLLKDLVAEGVFK
jgi:beta-lactamase regulating signal transducer with metallopeptidase domain